MRTSVRAIGLPIAMVAWLVIGAWLAGRICSDRWWLTQWLLWIPTPVALLAAAMGVIAALRPGRARGPSRRRLITWTIVAALLLSYFAVIEHRFFRAAAREPNGLKVAHWTVVETMSEQIDPFVDRVTSIDADLTILTNTGGAPGHPRLREWLGERGWVQVSHLFGILSKLPIVERRWLARKDDIAMLLLVIDAERVLGRELVIYLIDMPSSPKLKRARLAATARRLIDSASAPPPDMIIGDFNMTRGSVSLRSIAPNMHHAFSEGGHGYGATYHRRFPLYHIDHILLDESLRCVRYDVRPAEIGRHRPQVAWIVNDAP
jgi:hypothetical protein